MRVTTVAWTGRQIAGTDLDPDRVAPQLGIDGPSAERRVHPVVQSDAEARVWHLLSDPDPDARYHNLGPDFYDKRISPDRKKRNRIRQLEALGYQVTLTPAA